MRRSLRILVSGIAFLGVTAAAYAAAGFWPDGSGSKSEVSQSTSAPPPATEISRYSGLPLPRFVSIKTSRVNVRKGPSRQHPIAWSFVKKGLPLEIIRESENWRMVRDSQGSEGWIYHGLLSGARSVVIAPWEEDGIRELRDGPDARATTLAHLETGVVANVLTCNGAWCRIDAAGHQGWVSQPEVWGVYPGEAVN